MHELIAPLRRLLEAWTSPISSPWLRRRWVWPAVVALLAGSGITALAVAPLAPDAGKLPSRLWHEVLPTPQVQPQAQALAERSLELVRSTLTRSSDSADALLKRLGVSDAEAAAQLRRDARLARILGGRAARPALARTDADGRLLELVLRLPAETEELRFTHFMRLRWRAEQGRWVAKPELANLGTQLRLASGSIHSSLFAATDEAGLPDAVAVQLAEIFSGDVDFHRDLRRGDSFELVYEASSADGEPVPWNEGAGRVLAARFVNAGRDFQAFWHQGSDGRGAYFDADGRSRTRTYLTSPLAFSRVTSGFALRMHPLQKRFKAHLGVDYSAPRGTPVRAVGDGVVVSAGWQGGYGHTVVLRHGHNHQTLYAHLSRIDVKPGERVAQGARVGAVGATGWATGPHLHFEFRVGGVHQNPARVARETVAIELREDERERFGRMRETAAAQLAMAGTVASAPHGIE